jgi:uncharacterized membrane protein YdjX (TVP38/TMEM64 family)
LTGLINRRALVALLLFAGLVAVAVLLPLERWVVDGVTALRAAGLVGALVYAAVYVVATLAFLPAAPLTVGAGFAYGPVVGTLLVSPVSVLAASAAFALGRTVARPWVARRVARRPRFAALDAALGAGGLKLVVLLRLSPLLPFSVTNYGLGLTQVRASHFVLGSWLGMLPVTAAFVSLGALVPSPDALGQPVSAGDGALRTALTWIGVAATVAVAVLLTRAARAALARALPLPTPDAAPPAPQEPPR